MLDTIQVNGHMLVVVSVVPNQWGYLIVTFGLSLGRAVTATMVNRSLTRAEAIAEAINTLTNLGAI
jgi:hypothetical protein